MYIPFFKLKMFMPHHSCGNAWEWQAAHKIHWPYEDWHNACHDQQITQAVGQLPPHWEVHEAEVLEIQQVSLWALHFNHAVGTAMTLQ